MTDKEFISVFVQQKERFIKQIAPGDSNRMALDQFEKWLKEKLASRAAARGTREVRKQELGVLLDQVVNEATIILQRRGLRVNCVSFKVPGAKTTSRCLKVHPYDNIYYRICKTSPRKGKYRGMNLIAIELVMDGNKNNVFVPLLAQKENIEKQLGMAIERERQTIEATGKYRFKVFFRLDNYGASEIVRQLSHTLADFIYVTCQYLPQTS